MAKVSTSVTKAFALLETMARRPRPWGISELARELDLTKSNVHSHLQTLVELGFVRPDAGSTKYVPTLKIWEIGLQVTEGFPVRLAAQPHLAALAEIVKKTVHLAVLEGMEAVYIDRIEAPTVLEPKVNIGARAPAQCVATGLAMMSTLDNESLRRWDRPLDSPTERSPATFGEVMALVEKTRERGYARTHGSWRRGVIGIAAPIRVAPNGPHRDTVAGIGISCLDIGIGEDDIQSLAKYVVYCAERVSEALERRGA